MIFLITYIVVFVVFFILDKNFLGNMNRTVIWCFICIQACAPVDMDFPGSIEEFFKKMNLQVCVIWKSKGTATYE